PLDAYRGHHKLNLDQLPLTVRERLAADGLTGTLRVSFHQPPAPGSYFIHRTHPVVAALADTLLERALDETADLSDGDAVARAGAAFVDHVSRKTTVLLLRLRHQLSVTRGTTTRLMLCEETVAVSVAGSDNPEPLAPEAVHALLGRDAVRNMPPPVRNRHLQQALDQLPDWAPQLAVIAQDRALSLLQDHRRVREAAEAKGSYQVTASLPVDVMGLYVLIPAAGV
ncbi:MAG TPA: hypothetical protein VES73_12705, partial [Lamprocystis sp. (in: g-proteobacteria)]|nr:hypothetical protein [Lamprocystis sp. (in: g-proteobacteria)]